MRRIVCTSGNEELKSDQSLECIPLTEMVECLSPLSCEKNIQNGFKLQLHFAKNSTLSLSATYLLSFPIFARDCGWLRALGRKGGDGGIYAPTSELSQRRIIYGLTLTENEPVVEDGMGLDSEDQFETTLL